MKTLAQVRKAYNQTEGQKFQAYYYQDGDAWTVDYTYRETIGSCDTVFAGNFDDERSYKTEGAAATQAAKLAKGLYGEYLGRQMDFED